MARRYEGVLLEVVPVKQLATLRAENLVSVYHVAAVVAVVGLLRLFVLVFCVRSFHILYKL